MMSYDSNDRSNRSSEIDSSTTRAPVPIGARTVQRIIKVHENYNGALVYNYVGSFDESQTSLQSLQTSDHSTGIIIY